MLIALSIVHVLPEAVNMYNKFLILDKLKGGHDDHAGHDHRLLSGDDDHSTTTTTPVVTPKVDAHEEEAGHGFPVPYLFFFIGFFFMLFIDQVVFYTVGYNPNRPVVEPNVTGDNDKVEVA